MWEIRLRVTSNGMRVTEQYAPSWARLAPKPFRRIGRANGYTGELLFYGIGVLKIRLICSRFNSHSEIGFSG